MYDHRVSARVVRLINAEPEIVAALEEWDSELRHAGYFPGSIRARQHERVRAALTKVRPEKKS